MSSVRPVRGTQNGIFCRVGYLLATHGEVQQPGRIAHGQGRCGSGLRDRLLSLSDPARRDGPASTSPAPGHWPRVLHRGQCPGATTGRSRGVSQGRGALADGRVVGASARDRRRCRGREHDPVSTITTKDGTEIYYKDWGEGPVVTFSHGWPLSADAWDGQMLFLAQHGCRVVAHDRRGHGRSSQASSGNDMDGYADDLAAVIEALDLHDATLVGHSTGGGEVARYIGRHGTGRVAKAVLVAAVPPIMLKTRGQSRGPAAGGVRRPARGPHQGPVPVLQGSGDPVLRREPAGRQGLPGRAGSVLAVEHAVRPEERLRVHQGLLRDRLHRGPAEDRRAHPGHARRGRPDRSRQGLGAEIGQAHRGRARRSTTRARRTASPPPTRTGSTPTCWPSSAAEP